MALPTCFKAAPPPNLYPRPLDPCSCIRFPETFRLGAFTNPEAQLRTQAVTIAVEGCRWAAALGARELVVWSPYDGYDYTFQVDYQAAWRWTVEGFQHLADACPPGGWHCLQTGCPAGF